MQPRFTDVDIPVLDATIIQLSRALTTYPEVSDPRNYEVFHARAEARYARGLPIREVVNDLRCSAICLQTTARVRLYKLEPHRLKTRRLDPMHLALLHPNPEIVETMGSDCGVPLMTYYAGTGSPDLEAEIELFSPYFRSRQLGGPKDVPGLAAMTYAAALGYLMIGDESATGAVLRVLGEAVETLDEPPSDAGRRYLMQCAALADLLGRRAKEFSEHLIGLLPHTQSVEAKARSAAGERAGTEGIGAPDVVIPALAGLAALMNLDIDLGALKSAAPDQGALAAEVLQGWELVE